MFNQLVVKPTITKYHASFDINMVEETSQAVPLWTLHLQPLWEDHQDEYMMKSVTNWS